MAIEIPHRPSSPSFPSRSRTVHPNQLAGSELSDTSAVSRRQRPSGASAGVGSVLVPATAPRHPRIQKRRRSSPSSQWDQWLYYPGHSFSPLHTSLGRRVPLPEEGYEQFALYGLTRTAGQAGSEQQQQHQATGQLLEDEAEWRLGVAVLEVKRGSKRLKQARRHMYPGAVLHLPCSLLSSHMVALSDKDHHNPDSPNAASDSESDDSLAILDADDSQPFIPSQLPARSASVAALRRRNREAIEVRFIEFAHVVPPSQIHGEDGQVGGAVEQWGSVVDGELARGFGEVVRSK